MNKIDPVKQALYKEMKALKEYIKTLKVEKHSERAFEKSEMVSAIEFAPHTPIFDVTFNKDYL